MKTLTLTLISGLLAIAAHAQELTWSQLVQHPELWPAQCRLKSDFDFQSGASIKAGQTVVVLAIHPKEIEVGTMAGKAFSFDVKPEDTDVLAAAQAAYAKLTPKQRALTYAKIFQETNLWPYRLTVKAALDLGGGRRVNPGDKVTFFKVEDGRLLVGSEKFDTKFHVDPQDTDLLERAREYVERPGGAPNRLVAELQPNLISSATARPDPLDTNSLPRYLVFVRAANFCPISQRFLPALVKFDNENKTKHPEYQIIYLSCDQSPTDMEKFSRTDGFDWPTVSYQRSGYLFQVNPHFQPLMPQFTVMDLAGRVLVSGVGEMENGVVHATSTEKNGQAPKPDGQSAAAALKQFAMLLDQPAAQN